MTDNEEYHETNKDISDHMGRFSPNAVMDIIDVNEWYIDGDTISCIQSQLIAEAWGLA
jgi:hypothetical protein